MPHNGKIIKSHGENEIPEVVVDSISQGFKGPSLDF